VHMLHLTLLMRLSSHSTNLHLLYSTARSLPVRGYTCLTFMSHAPTDAPDFDPQGKGGPCSTG